MSGVILALHTSDAVGSVAVGRDGTAVGHEFASAGHAAPIVLQEILEALNAARLTLADCEAAAVTLGPGSFTGIRIGLATVQGLAAARRWPVFTSDSLMAVAAACRPATGRLAVVFDARRGEVYAALYDVAAAPAAPAVAPGTLPPAPVITQAAQPPVAVPALVLEPFCAPVADAAERLARAAADTHLALAGSGAALVQACAPLGSARIERLAMPVAVALARLAQAGACRHAPARGLEPVYLRKSDAELQRHAAGGRPA